jgi:hypothetical protein
MEQPMPKSIHHSYLLRLWREQEGAPMRATLVAVARPEERQHFADLDALCAFLRAHSGQEPDAHDDEGTTYCTPSETS